MEIYLSLLEQTDTFRLECNKNKTTSLKMNLAFPI